MPVESCAEGARHDTRPLMVYIAALLAEQLSMHEHYFCACRSQVGEITVLKVVLKLNS